MEEHVPSTEKQTVPEPNQALERLVQLGFLQSVEGNEDAFLIHDMTAAFARDVAADVRAQAVVEEILLAETQHHNQRNDPDALAAWQVHLRAATDRASKRGDVQAAALCQELAAYLFNTGDYEGAHYYYEQALIMRQAVLGDQHPETARSFRRLGYLHQAVGNYEQAFSYFQSSLAILEALSGPDHPDLVATLSKLGNLLQTQRRFADALPYFERVLAIQRQALGETHPDIAATLNDLGHVHYRMEAYAEAQVYYGSVLALQTQLVPEDYPAITRTLIKLGNSLRRGNNFEEAQQYYEQALQIQQQVLGTGHLDVAETRIRLAEVCQRRGNYDDAQRHLEAALTIHRSALGERHADTAELLHRLGALMQDQSRYEAAVGYYEQVLAVAGERSDQRLERLVRCSLGATYGVMGQVTEAVAHYQLALDADISDPMEEAKILTALGTLMRDSDQAEQAKTYWSRSRDIYERLESPLASGVVSLLEELGASNSELFSLGELAQRFFRAAGFQPDRDDGKHTFLCRARSRARRRKFRHPIPVWIRAGEALDARAVRALYQPAAKTAKETPIIFVVVDRTPTDDGWLQIGTARAEGVKIVPIDDSVLLAGQERGREGRELDRHLRRFLGKERDLYNVRDPVADKLNFFGREALAAELIEQLTQGRPIILLGLRKMGKSSLLNYLRDTMSCPTALVDLQAGMELGGLFDRMLASWQRSLRVKARGIEWTPPRLVDTSDPAAGFTLAVRDLLEQLEANDIKPRLCLLVDEADLIIVRDEAGQQRYLTFARTLRGFIQEEDDRLSLLIAAVDPTLNRTNRLSGQQNPFYQFFREEYVPPLPRDDCIQMVRSIGRQIGLAYSDEAVALVADISGGHPFIARQLCSLAFQRLERVGDVPFAHLQETAVRFVREPGTAELLDENGLWGEISDPHLWPDPQITENRAILTTLADREPQPEQALLQQARDRRACERSLDELARRAVLGQPAVDAYHIPLRLFRHWIRRYQLGQE